MRPETLKRVDAALDALFERLKDKFLGVRRDPDALKPRVIRFSTVRPELTLAGLAQASALEAGARVTPDTLLSLAQIAESYLDSARGQARALVLSQIQALEGEGRLTSAALGGALQDTWSQVTHSVDRILDTAAQKSVALGALEGVTLMNAQVGVDDPTVMFIVVRDGLRCSECTRLHLMPDGVTPRLWRLSEVGHGFHKRGDDRPKIAGLHPRCRCRLSTVLPGYGFDADGKVRFIALGHDALAQQREGLQKSEPYSHQDCGCLGEITSLVSPSGVPSFEPGGEVVDGLD